MTSFQIVALYVALNLLLALLLTMRVSKQRMAKKVSIGDGDNPDLLASIRTHANFTETSPFVLIGLIALAMMGAHHFVLHIFGAGFLLGRILHMHGMAQSKSNGTGRGLGALLTMLIILSQAIYLLYLVFTFTT